LPNLDPWINQNEDIAPNKFENHLQSIKAEHQNQIRPNLHHPTYNERHEKIIEWIDWTLEKYKETAAATNLKKLNQNEEETIIIDNIIEELDNKRDIAINKKNKALLKDEVSVYRLEENTLDYVLFIIREVTGKLY
jgi:spore coat polysaccharide biosynthesis protein SpsF (cytidylyltransferase family)